MRAGSTPAAPTIHLVLGRHIATAWGTEKNYDDMKTLGYCVATATLCFLADNGGVDANTMTWALSLVGIIAAILLLAHDKETDKGY